MSEVMQEAVLFDAEHLARYTLGDAGLEREVLDLFLEQALALQAQLADTAAAGRWREAAHTLKGSARGVGAFRLGEAASALEAAGEAAGGQPARAALLQRLAGDIEATRAAMLRHLAACERGVA